MTEVLKALHRIVNEAIRAQELTMSEDPPRFYDLSAINLEKLRDEFAKKVPVLHQSILDRAAHEPHVGIRGATGSGGVERAVREVPFDGTEHQEVRTR